MQLSRTCATLIVAAALLAGCAGAAPRSEPGHTALLSAQQAESNRVRTEHVVDRLLAGIRLPKGARQRTKAPAPELRGSAGGTVGSNIVRRHRWWTSNESVRAVLAYVKHHGPRGCRFDTTGTSTGPDQRTVHDIGCFGRSNRHTYEPEVDIEAVGTRHGSAIRADVEAIWMPKRPAYSYVEHARAVRAVVERHAAPGRRRSPTVRRTLDRAAAKQLARVLDRQTMAPPVAISCPADFFGVNDQLRFATPRGRVTVTVDLTGCPGIYVKVPHHPATALQGASKLDAVVLRVLHLPRRYHVG